MKEFNYDLDYKSLDFTNKKTRKLYRIGRGEQGVLLVRPYTNAICSHWRFKTPNEAIVSANKIHDMYLNYQVQKDFIGMDMCRKFLEMGFTRARRYANHNDGKKYDDEATKAQIKRAFVKSLKTKKLNKKVLGEFIELVA